MKKILMISLSFICFFAFASVFEYNGKRIVTEQKICLLKLKLQDFYVANGFFPENLQGLIKCGGRIDLVKDGWGEDFIYSADGDCFVYPEQPEDLPYIIVSYGGNKKRGGVLYGKDICSWNCFDDNDD